MKAAFSKRFIRQYSTLSPERKAMGVEVTTAEDRSQIALGAARELGYQPNDRAGLDRALDKIAPLDVKVVATMHGPHSPGTMTSW